MQVLTVRYTCTCNCLYNPIKFNCPADFCLRPPPGDTPKTLRPPPQFYSEGTVNLFTCVQMILSKLMHGIGVCQVHRDIPGMPVCKLRADAHLVYMQYTVKAYLHGPF